MQQRAYSDILWEDVWLLNKSVVISYRVATKTLDLETILGTSLS